jgi:hypothetical protein
VARGGDVNWRGKDVAAKLRRVAAVAINETVAEAVKRAKSEHPGWENQSGTAEGSIQLLRAATPGAAKPYAEWGSKAVVYMRRLEYEHGGALRGAAQIEHQQLPARMKARMK